MIAEKASLIDEFLPDYNFSAVHKTNVLAAPSIVYQQILNSKLSDLWLLRVLLALRTGKRVPSNHGLGGLRRQIQGSGFVILQEVPDREIAIGVVGKFWRPDGGRVMDMAASDFATFSEMGYAKVVWNFKVQSDTTGGAVSVLSTETRIHCLGGAALWKFRAYWSVVGPFSGLIRLAMLKNVKARAERSVLSSRPIRRSD